MFFHRYEWIIGLRYLRAKRSEHFIGVITVLSMGGIALGVAALIVVLAVMTGFKEELQRQILGVTSHVVVQPFAGQMNNNPETLAKITNTVGVVGAAPYVVAQAMLSANGVARGAVIRGIDPELDRKVSSLAEHIKTGSLDQLSKFGIILGRHLASNLGVVVGDMVTVISPSGNVTAAGSTPRMKRFRVAGIFDSGMYEYDNTLAYIHLGDAQTFFRLGDQITGVEVKTIDPDMSPSIGKVILATLDFAYWVRDWTQMNRNFFRALKIEKITMTVILFLVVVVAAFNIISSLIMVVMEKGKDIAILKTMGASSSSILSIFLLNGCVIGVFGTLIGVGLGLALALNLEAAIGGVERLFDVKILASEVYFIDHLPAKVEVPDVLWIGGISLLISLFSTLYPAWRAARVDPVEALRYE